MAIKEGPLPVLGDDISMDIRATLKDAATEKKDWPSSVLFCHIEKLIGSIFWTRLLLPIKTSRVLRRAWSNAGLCCYYEDMYVNFKLVTETTPKIAGIRLWITIVKSSILIW